MLVSSNDDSVKLLVLGTTVYNHDATIIIHSNLAYILSLCLVVITPLSETINSNKGT